MEQAQEASGEDSVEGELIALALTDHAGQGAGVIDIEFVILVTNALDQPRLAHARVEVIGARVAFPIFEGTRPVVVIVVIEAKLPLQSASNLLVGFTENGSILYVCAVGGLQRRQGDVIGEICLRVGKPLAGDKMVGGFAHLGHELEDVRQPVTGNSVPAYPPAQFVIPRTQIVVCRTQLGEGIHNSRKQRIKFALAKSVFREDPQQIGKKRAMLRGQKRTSRGRARLHRPPTPISVVGQIRRALIDHEGRSANSRHAIALYHGSIACFWTKRQVRTDNASRRFFRQRIA